MKNLVLIFDRNCICQIAFDKNEGLLAEYNDKNDTVYLSVPSLQAPTLITSSISGNSKELLELVDKYKTWITDKNFDGRHLPNARTSWYLFVRLLKQHENSSIEKLNICIKHMFAFLAALILTGKFGRLDLSNFDNDNLALKAVQTILEQQKDQRKCNLPNKQV